MNKKYFGTDGIRGHVGGAVIHPAFMLKLGWALGRVLGQNQRKKVLIGKDTRISGYMIESALEAGLSAAGADVRLLGPMPTPAIAYLTQTFRASAGVVISASHNPFEDNGIKFFDSNGGKFPDELEAAIEAELAKPFDLVPSHALGKASRIPDASGRYIEFCKSTIPSLTRLHGVKIVIDCANGATYHIAPNVFRELGAEVFVISDRPDGFNINKECGSTHPEKLREQVLEHQADVGLAFDGDGDRIIMVDHKGQIVNGDGLLYLIAMERHQKNRLNGGVVGTLMSNMGLELKLKSMDVPFVRTNVGDRYVLSALKEQNWKIGGETSGHIVCLDKTTTGDGIISALQVLSYMVHEQKSLAELMNTINLFPQVLFNIKTQDSHLLMNNPQIKREFEKHSSELEGRGRILVRPSGTEPLLRILLEGEDENEINHRRIEIEHVIEEQGITA
jgi:phosphoglucosamine mutase